MVASGFRACLKLQGDIGLGFWTRLGHTWTPEKPFEFGVQVGLRTVELP